MGLYDNNVTSCRSTYHNIYTDTQRLQTLITFTKTLGPDALAGNGIHPITAPELERHIYNIYTFKVDS